MMQVRINGELKNLQGAASLKAALTELEIESRYFAVAVNRTFIPKTLYEQTPLQEGDEIEILSPMQGG